MQLVQRDSIRKLAEVRKGIGFQTVIGEILGDIRLKGRVLNRDNPVMVAIGDHPDDILLTFQDRFHIQVCTRVIHFYFDQRKQVQSLLMVGLGNAAEHIHPTGSVAPRQTDGNAHGHAALRYAGNADAHGIF